MEKVDVIIIGAGAAGFMCGIEAGKRGRKVVILDHANKAGKKILMSGGGRCNFTNLYVDPKNYISHNPHFCKSALGRYTQWDFIDLVKKHRIPYHEKTQGQLFCDHKSQDIVDMLFAECELASVAVRLNATVDQIQKLSDHHFKVKSNRGEFHCQSLVIASGGLSIPTMGASPFGYKIAEQFGLKVWPTRAGLVPLTLHTTDKEKLSPLSGIAVESLVSVQRQSFRENILFTHRGLSGPAILQISSYWHPGEEIMINMLPDLNLLEHLKLAKKQQSQKQLKTILCDLLPKRVVETFVNSVQNITSACANSANNKHIINNDQSKNSELLQKIVQSISMQELEWVAEKINTWVVKPNGTEGYRTAEVTLGGVDCDAISSKTMEANNIPGLYFIGEVLDVSGWLGGFNFQWAWASGWAAGQVV